MKKKKNQRHTAHKLNNALATINLSVEVLVRELYGSVNNRQNKYLKMILSETEKIRKIIDSNKKLF